MTVDDLVDRYLEHCRRYYRRPDGSPTTEAGTIGQALAVAAAIAGRTDAESFGPAALHRVREAMIARGWSRRHINNQVVRLRGMFRWAVDRELIGLPIYERLRAVRGLAPHRSAAPEHPSIQPAPDSHVEAVRPFVAPQVWTLIRLQQLTAARAGELVALRLLGLDMSRDDVWVYRPDSHKTAWAGRRRSIWLGAGAIELLMPYLQRPVTAPLLSPAEAYRARLGRTPPPWVGEAYTTASYRRCIDRACRRAGVPVWSPHQIRHAAATRLRREHGIEVARLILGHASTTTTEVYAERDADLAASIMRRIG